MKDIIYEQDYSELKRDVLELSHTQSSRDAWKYITNEGVMKAIGERLRELPHVIVPQNKAIFEECERRLDRLALDRGGRIRSVVSYEMFDAFLYLDLPFFEFYGEALETIKYIANNARSFSITENEDGTLRLSVRVDYFEDLGDMDAIIEEEIKKHPDLVDMFERRHEEERDAALADPRVYDMVVQLAEGTGMTPEEWFDYMSRAIEEHPEILKEIMDETLDKRREEKRTEE